MNSTSPTKNLSRIPTDAQNQSYIRNTRPRILEERINNPSIKSHITNPSVAKLPTYNAGFVIPQINGIKDRNPLKRITPCVHRGFMNKY